MNKIINLKNYKRLSLLIALFLIVCVHHAFICLLIGFPIFSIGMKLNSKENTYMSSLGKIFLFIGLIIYSFPIVLVVLYCGLFIFSVIFILIAEPLGYLLLLFKTISLFILGLFMFWVVIKAFSDTAAGFVSCKSCGVSFPNPKRIDGKEIKAMSYTCSDCK